MRLRHGTTEMENLCPFYRTTQFSDSHLGASGFVSPLHIITSNVYIQEDCWILLVFCGVSLQHRVIILAGGRMRMAERERRLRGGHGYLQGRLGQSRRGLGSRLRGGRGGHPGSWKREDLETVLSKLAVDRGRDPCSLTLYFGLERESSNEKVA